MTTASEIPWTEATFSKPDRRLRDVIAARLDFFQPRFRTGSLTLSRRASRVEQKPSRFRSRLRVQETKLLMRRATASV